MHPYSSAAYASAFREESVWLPEARTHVLKRPIPGTDDLDATGCYPICVFQASAGFDSDMTLLARGNVVALVLVTDCLTQPNEDFLRSHFEVCRTYKVHHVYDARLPGADYSKHHRDRVRRARKSCETRVVKLGDHLAEWIECYDTLIRRKNITGIQAFPRFYFERLAEMSDGVTTVAAFAADRFVSAHIWVHHEGAAYAHLAASTPLGYKLRSAFAIYDHAIQLFRDDHVIDFGGGAGIEEGEGDGLSAFKKGFANSARQNFLCGKVIDPEKYAAHCRVRGVDPSTSFFPAYRRPA